MENTIETNEPVTIKITIEIIPSKSKSPAVPKPEKIVTLQPIEVIPKDCYHPLVEDTVVVKPEGWAEMVVEPMTTTPPIMEEKKKRAYTRKPKEVASPVETPKEETVSPVVTTPPVALPDHPASPPITTNKVTARLAQMIRFYCKASGIETSSITIADLKEKAFDIVENVSDDVIKDAIKEASGK
jgi:hypothetical protein